MKKSRFFYLGLIAVLGLGAILIVAGTIKQFKKVCAKNFCIQAELAATDKAREKGLMFRKSMPEDQGILFIFEKEALYNFWMKNTRFPLDIIWIDGNKKIVDIYEYALPCKDVCKTIAPRTKALFVLEVNAGFTKKYGMKIGDSLNF
jgi:uncharacterized membrane protein (UPF0127 family)